MRKYVVLNLIVLCLLVAFHKSISKEYGDIAFFVMFTSGLIVEFGIFYLMRRRSSGRYEESLEEKLETDNGEYHNDFSKVGSGDRNIAVKPIDYTGNVFSHNEETLIEDLNNIGIDPKLKN